LTDTEDSWVVTDPTVNPSTGTHVPVEEAFFKPVTFTTMACEAFVRPEKVWVKAPAVEA